MKDTGGEPPPFADSAPLQAPESPPESKLFRKIWEHEMSAKAEVAKKELEEQRAQEAEPETLPPAANHAAIDPSEAWQKCRQKRLREEQECWDA